MRCKGIVKGNVILLEEGVHLPDGAQVTVTLEQQDQVEEEVTAEELEQRRDLVTRMKAFGERLKERHVNLADLILEGREELEERA
jgi:hypothetical protein